MDDEPDAVDKGPKSTCKISVWAKDIRFPNTESHQRDLMMEYTKDE